TVDDQHHQHLAQWSRRSRAKRMNQLLPFPVRGQNDRVAERAEAIGQARFRLRVTLEILSLGFGHQCSADRNGSDAITSASARKISFVRRSTTSAGKYALARPMNRSAWRSSLRAKSA